MGLYQKYAELTIEEVYQWYCDIEREKHPNQVIELINEIKHRQAHGEDPLKQYSNISSSDIDINRIEKLRSLKGYEELSFEFQGTPRAYFRIWIVNLCLTLLTLGIFSAWAKVRKKRFFYSHTLIGDTPFQYLGQPIPILKGRLVAAVGFAVYYFSTHFMTSLFPLVLIAGLLAAPWVLVRSAAFNARYSAFRNITFHLDAGYWDAVKALYAWGIVPAFVAGLILEKYGNPYILGALSLLLGIHVPFLICRVKRFIVENTCYGGKRGEFGARGGQFFGIYFASGLVMFAFSILSFILIFALGAWKNMGIKIYISSLPIYIGYVLAYAYIRANSANLVWNNARLGPIQFISNLETSGLTKLYFTNALGIIFSCGFLIPWAVIRTIKYRVSHMRVMRGGELAQFQGSKQHSVAAVGAETLDIFDWDLSL